MEYNKKNVGEIFKKVDPKKKDIIINEVIKSTGVVDIWDPAQDIREQFKVESLDDKKNLILMPGSQQSQLVGINTMLTFEYKNLQYFLAETLSYDIDKKRYVISAAGTLLKCDHRKDVRIPMKFLEKLELVINNQPGFTFPCLDFSAGGVSVVIDDDKASVFKKNRTFREVVLAVNPKRFQIPCCRVLYSRQVEEGIQVGIAFEELTLFTKKEIKAYTQQLIYQIVSGKN